MCDRELGVADLLAAKQVADRFDGLELVIKVGFKVEFHVMAQKTFPLVGTLELEHLRYASISRSPLGFGIGSPNSFAVSIQRAIA